MPLNINSIRGNITGLHEATPLNIKSICGNIRGLHEATSLNINSIRGNIKGLHPYPKIGESNREKAHWLYLKIGESNRETQHVYNQPVWLHKVQREVRPPNKITGNRTRVKLQVVLPVPRTKRVRTGHTSSHTPSPKDAKGAYGTHFESQVKLQGHKGFMGTDGTLPDLKL